MYFAVYSNKINKNIDIPLHQDIKHLPLRKHMLFPYICFQQFLAVFSNEKRNLENRFIESGAANKACGEVRNPYLNMHKRIILEYGRKVDRRLSR